VPEVHGDEASTPEIHAAAVGRRRHLPSERALTSAPHDDHRAIVRFGGCRQRNIVGRVTDLNDIEFQQMDGSTSTLREYAGNVVLVVNVASHCGLTPQYEALQRLYADRNGEGLTVLGFPANDFAGQEPGTDEEIAEFCSTTYSVTFPVMSKISVVGDDQHALYGALTSAAPTAEGKSEFREVLRGHGLDPSDDPDVLWNFEKFLIGRNGEVVARFAPPVTPDSPEVVAAIDAELGR
jgi:glutathione peroxidase